LAIASVALGSLLLACGSTVVGTSAGSTTGSGGGCHGDAVSWAMLTQGPIACTKSSDCCVIFNDCTFSAQVVAAADVDAAKTSWPYCDSTCVQCVPPEVEVGCVNGFCTGAQVSVTSSTLWKDHCGADGTDVDAGATSFLCGTGAASP
jgi:hypothetical protein